MDSSSQKPAEQTIRSLSIMMSDASLHFDNSDDDDCYGGNTGRSIELEILRESQKNTNCEQLNIEIRIVEYLKSLDLKMKTDPLAKKDRYYRKRQNKKANTQLFNPQQTQAHMTPPTSSRQLNTIMVRRNTQSSLPQIEIQAHKPRKSQFAQKQEDENF